MLWHVVKFRFAGDVDQEDRLAFEAMLRRLADDIDVISLLRVARSIDEPDVTGLITGVADEPALAVYRDHPHHQPVLARGRKLCSEIVRLDIITSDPPGALPRVA